MSRLLATLCFTCAFLCGCDSGVSSEKSGSSTLGNGEGPELYRTLCSEMDSLTEQQTAIFYTCVDEQSAHVARDKLNTLADQFDEIILRARLLQPMDFNLQPLGSAPSTQYMNDLRELQRTRSELWQILKPAYSKMDQKMAELHSVLKAKDISNND